MRLHLAVLAVAGFIAGGCTTPIRNTLYPDGEPVASSTPIRWRDAACIARQPFDPSATRDSLWRLNCAGRGGRDFVSLALSGGGTKSAVFSAEAMFYMDSLGLLPQAGIVSSVSGGSFPAAYYALSCDQGDLACLNTPVHGLKRPVWEYAQAMSTLGSGYGPVIQDQVARLLVPFIGASISASTFADHIDKSFFGVPDPEANRFRFADLDPRRPHIYMNATIITDNRGGLGDESGHGCVGLKGRGHLRRRTPDEWFHFTFTDYYFGLLHSKLADYPVSGGVAASAAFAALIDPAVLEDGCNPGSNLRLIDGGANDNQALVELYIALAELAYDQRRSDLRPPPDPGAVPGPRELQVMNKRDRAWIFVVNSSVTSSTGPSGTAATPAPRGLISFLASTVSKAFQVIDVFTAEGFALRSQLYLHIRDELQARPDSPALVPVEIALTELDQYSQGGTEAALRTKSGYQDEVSDAGERWSRARIDRQRLAYQKIMADPGYRKRLGLSRFHPQCYYNMRDELDSLVSLSDDNKACLREAARWATALRMQEICDRPLGIAPPEGLPCAGGLLRPARAFPQIELLPGRCQPKLDPNPVSSEDVCRLLPEPASG